MSYREVLEKIASKIADRSADTELGDVILSLADELDTSFELLRQAVRDVTTGVNEQQTLLFNKMHTVSNHVMALEGKIDEMMEYLHSNHDSTTPKKIDNNP